MAGPADPVTPGLLDLLVLSPSADPGTSAAPAAVIRARPIAPASPSGSRRLWVEVDA